LKIVWLIFLFWRTLRLLQWSFYVILLIN